MTREFERIAERLKEAFDEFSNTENPEAKQSLADEISFLLERMADVLELELHWA